MVKLFLVEDEIIMRDGIKNNIDWEAEGIEFVGEASDGELAYPQIQKLKPDILVTDIKMPFMDGLELAQLVRKDFPEMKIIILSGYDDFSYAQKAVSLNVTEYLLKPISPQKLLEPIRREAKQIEQSRREQECTDLTEEVKRERRILEKQIFFRKIVRNELQMTEILEKGRELDMELSASWYQIILVYIDTADGKTADYSERQNEILHKISRNMLTVPGWYDFDRGTEGMAVLVLGDSEEELNKKVDENIARIVEIVRGYQEAAYFIGIGTCVNRLRQLGESYDEANRAFAHRFMQTESTVFDSRKMSGKDEGKETGMDFHDVDISRLDRKVISNFLHMGAVDEVGHFITEYFESMGRQNVQSVIFLQYITMDIYFCIAAFLEEIGYGMEDVTDECGDINDVVKRFTTLDKVKEYFEKILTGALKLRDSISQKKFSQLMKKAKNYMEANYNRDDISLNNVAAQVNVSPNYFSTIFSQETGKTFCESLTEIRMGKAKELLMTTGKKTSEIAYDVGYKDPHYFSFMFKKTQGCTAREYRNRK
jgi:two-component system response regulator YesN